MLQVSRKSSFFFLILIFGARGSMGENQSERGVVLVSTTAGKVLGLPKETRWGKVVHYFGIPYAEIPTDTMRFLLSVPLLGQNSSISSVNKPTTHHNTRSPPACIQPVHNPEFSHPSIPQGGVQVSEDCLKMNVYQPFDIAPNELLPIMVFVPGNGYSYADMVQYDGSALAAVGRVVVATINYRVGAFGFISMGNSTLPGNAGLSDIASALKFIIGNAKAFNGDPNLVTLAGRFSGAMAITTLVTSPLFYTDAAQNKPLAKRVILHAGAATSDYTIDSNPSQLFSKFVAEANCFKEDSKESLLCLQTLETSKLQQIGEKFISKWKPAIDGITVIKNPITSIEFGKFSSDISFLVGDNFDSGSICYDTLKFLKSSVLSNLITDNLTEDQFGSLAKDNIKEFYKIEDSSRLINLTAHEYYFRPAIQSSWRNAFFRFCSSLYIRNPVELFARYASRLNSVVYRYEFAYRPTTSIYPAYFEGALGDEIIFLFPTEKTKMGDNDFKVARSFLEAWGNFIKTGNPSSKEKTWEAFNEINKTLVGFTGNGLQMSTTNNLDADVHFWRQVFLPLYKILGDSNCIKENNPTTLTSQPPLSKGRGLSPLSISIIILVLTVAGTALVVGVIRARERGYSYKWSW